MATITDPVYRAQGDERLVQALLVAPDAFTLNASHYWTVTLRVRRGTQTDGEIVGSEFSLATRKLDAGTPVTLYADENGTPLDEGDTVWAISVSTGTPAAFRPTVHVEIQR